MVGQHRGDKEEEREVAGMRRLHRLEQSLSEDPFLLPPIDQLVDATVGHPRMSFLDASKDTFKYHWPWMIRRKRLLSPPLGLTIIR